PSVGFPSPWWGGGTGAAGGRGQESHDGGVNPFDIVRDIEGVEPQHTIALRLHEGVASFVVSLIAVTEMLAAVDLHDKLGAMRGEVRIERAELNLAAKVKVPERFHAEEAPDGRLDRRHGLSQASGPFRR